MMGSSEQARPLQSPNGVKILGVVIRGSGKSKDRARQTRLNKSRIMAYELAQ